VSLRRAIGRITRPEMPRARRPASVRPASVRPTRPSKMPTKRPPAQPREPRDESGVRPKVAPAPAATAAGTGGVEELVVADLSGDPRCD
jgi:hypothetical protein